MHHDLCAYVRAVYVANGIREQHGPSATLMNTA